MLESRGHLRYSIEGKANIKPDDEPSRTISADLVDVCSTGVAVRANEKIETEASVSFELIIKQCDKPIPGKGKVKYLKEVKEGGDIFFRIGIQFIDVDKEEIRFIIAHIHGKTYVENRKKPPKPYR